MVITIKQEYNFRMNAFYCHWNWFTNLPPFASGNSGIMAASFSSLGFLVFVRPVEDFPSLADRGVEVKLMTPRTEKVVLL
jgi:hypothetical protein